MAMTDDHRVALLARRLEEYGFAGLAGPLENCKDWTDLKEELGLNDAQTRFHQVEDGWLETYTGVKFHFLEPVPEEINLLDIAHALANTGRYGGHTRQFYSVAEHSMLMAEWLRKQGGTPLTVFTTLMHDAAETYIGDLCRPLKVLLPDFKAIEEKIDVAVACRFGTVYPFPPVVKELDSRILVDERRQLMSDSGNVWFTDTLEPLGVHISCLPPNIAEPAFRQLFYLYSKAVERGDWGNTPDVYGLQKLEGLGAGV